MLSPIKPPSSGCFPRNSVENDELLKYELLKSMLKYDEKVLVAVLNSESFSQKLLCSLFFSACEMGKIDVVPRIVGTRSYTTVIQANIVVEALALNNPQTKCVCELINAGVFESRVLDKALLLVMERGAGSQDADPLIAELINLGAKVPKTAQEITRGCDESSTLVLPGEIWINTFSFFSTRQELAPLRLVSKAFKACADDPRFARISYAELDYSSLISEKIISYNVFPHWWPSRPHCFIMLSNGRAIVGGEGDNNLYLNDLGNYQRGFFGSQREPERKTLTGHTAPVIGICDFKENLIISASNDKTLRVWDLKTNKCIKILSGHEKAVSGVVKLDESHVISASLDATVRIWDIEKGKCVKILKRHSDLSIFSIIKLPQRNLFLTVEVDGKVYLWNAETGKGKYISLAEGTFVHSITRVSDDKLILRCKGGIGVVRISALFEGKKLTNYQEIKCTDWGRWGRCLGLPNGDIACLVTTSAWDDPKNCRLRIYDMRKKEFILDHEMDTVDHCSYLALLPDQRIAVCSSVLQIFPFAVKNKEAIQHEPL
jgi:WD40 repeat protein